MAKVLIVDDEPNIIELAKLYLEREQHEVTGVHSGREALRTYESLAPDIIILDLMLGDLDGFEVCKQIRAVSAVPILMLTARKEDTDKIIGLELGADDYLTKPFNPLELLARVKAILRRSRSDSETEDTIDLGKLHIDLLRREVTIDGEQIPLRTKEFSLLTTFTQNIGIVFDREALLEKVWGYDYYGETRTVDVHINHLRDKLAGSDIAIETIRGIGYKMVINGEQK